ncbi:MAG: hypothetical protein ACOCRB_00830 [Halanaerobiaceae bacterium]
MTENKFEELNQNQIQVTRNALDRVPLSIIIDDSAPLVNLNYFWLRDRHEYNPQKSQFDSSKNKSWEELPVVIPEKFTREFGEWCRENGVKGKFSVIPCPAALGRIDRGLPPFSKKQINNWLNMCREVITPNFDITPEMLTHTFVLDPDTLKPIEPRIWEQGEWVELKDLELTVKYIKKAINILKNVGLTPEGVTSPGGFGHKSRGLYSKAVNLAFKEVTDLKIPYFFQQVEEKETGVYPEIWYPEREKGRALGEPIATTTDKTGSWTGYGERDSDYYITPDLKEGRLPEIIEEGGQGILISHWQGFYGLHNRDRGGFKILKTVVNRLQERDPYGEQTQWRKISEIVKYAVARDFARIEIKDDELKLDLPVRVSDFTLKIDNLQSEQIIINGVSLKPVDKKKDFKTGTFYQEGDKTLLAFDPESREVSIEFGY